VLSLIKNGGSKEESEEERGVTDIQGGVSFLNQYGMSLRRALLDLYPDIDAWELHRFRQKGMSSCVGMKLLLFLCLFFIKLNYTDLASFKFKQNRKTFFDSIAQKRDFDPLIASNWYSISKSAFTRSKVCYCSFSLSFLFLFPIY
jgi:hypothetical protein